MRRAIRLANMAPAIRLKTIERPLIISITMMKEVSGAWVAAARKPAMPSAMRLGARALWLPANTWATSCPMPAPMDSDGAKMPAGTPLQEVIQVATNFSSTYRWEMSLSPASMFLTSSAPAPKVAPPLTRPMMATTRPAPAAKRIGAPLRQRLNRSGKPSMEAASRRANRPPSKPHTTTTTRPGQKTLQLRRGTAMEPK